MTDKKAGNCLDVGLDMQRAPGAMGQQCNREYVQGASYLAGMSNRVKFLAPPIG